MRSPLPFRLLPVGFPPGVPSRITRGRSPTDICGIIEGFDAGCTDGDIRQTNKQPFTYLDANVARYAANRKILLDELPRIGLDRLAPADGAFYVYADVRHLTNDSEEFCRRMLEETGVAAAPGIDFDQSRGRGYVRFSFAGATADMTEAARRLKAWLPRSSNT